MMHHFTVSGPYLVETARNLVLDGQYTTAHNFLRESLAEIPEGTITEVLNGNKTLSGADTVTLVDEDESTRGDYLNLLASIYEDRVRIGTNWYQLFGIFRVTPAWRIYLSRNASLWHSDHLSKIERFWYEQHNERVKIIKVPDDSLDMTRSGVVGETLVILMPSEAPPPPTPLPALMPDLEYKEVNQTWAAQPEIAEFLDSCTLYAFEQHTVGPVGLEERIRVIRPWYEELDETPSMITRRKDQEGNDYLAPEYDPPLPFTMDRWTPGKEAPPVYRDVEALLANMDYTEVPFDEDSLIELREEVLQQTNEGPGGWTHFRYKGQIVEVPRGAFECWAMRSERSAEIRAKATPWQPISPVGLKSTNDCRYHTDWLVGARIWPLTMDKDASPDFLGVGAWRALDGLSEAAYEAAGDIQERLRGVGEGLRVTIIEGTGNVITAPVDFPNPGDECEPDCIAILPTGGPAYEAAVRSARAVVLQRGGIACHLASIARKEGHTMVWCKELDQLQLQPGDVVTLDLNQGVIFAN